jgi:hypothetical protein
MSQQSMDMSATSNLAPALLQAYRETHYRVNSESSDSEPLLLRVGEASKPLAILHKKFGVDCSAFITACNPWSESLPDAQNSRRQENLLHTLRTRSLRWLEGIGQHPSNQWPGEPSVLILGLSLAAAKVLAEDFEQNAFVWSGSDARPQLVLLR